jgi:hypothetical protein
MTLFLVFGVVALVIGVLVAVALGMRSKRADDREQTARRRPRSAAYGEEPEFLEEPEPGGRRAADSRRRNSRRPAGARSGRYEAAPRSRAGQDDRYDDYADYDDYDDTGAGLDVDLPLGSRASAGGRAGLSDVVAEADERDRPEPQEKPGSRRGGSQRKRPRQGRGRPDSADAGDWPDSDWTSVSEADFWADISSDKPLATTARSAQSAADLSPPADLDEPAPAGRRSRRARAAESEFDSPSGQAQSMVGNGPETVAIPARSSHEPLAREYESSGYGYEPAEPEYTDPNLAVLASLGVTPPEGSQLPEPGAVSSDPLTSSAIPEVPGSRSSSRWNDRSGNPSWDTGREPGYPGGTGYGADPGATQAFQVGGSPGYGLPEPGSHPSYPDEFYPGGSFPGDSYLSSSYPDGSHSGESRDSHGLDSYGEGSYGGGSRRSDSYPGDFYSGDSFSSWDSYFGSSYGSDSRSSGTHLGDSYPGDSYSGSGGRNSYPGGSYPGGSYDGTGPLGHDYGSPDGGSYGTGSHGSLGGEYGTGSLGSDSYRSGSYGDGSYSGSGYDGGSYGGSSYGSGSYPSGSHGDGSYSGSAYDAGSYGSDSYGSDSYGGDSYGGGPYGSGPYGGSSYGDGSYGNGSYSGSSYGSDSYGGSSYGGSSHGDGSHSGSAYDAGSYGSGSYNGGSYGSSSYGSSSYGSDSYPSGSHGDGSYSGSAYDAGSYGSGSYGSGSYGSGSYGSGPSGSGDFGSDWNHSDPGGPHAHEAGADSYDAGPQGHNSYGYGSHQDGSHEPDSYGAPGPASPPMPNASPGRYSGGYLSSSALSARQPNPASPSGNPYGSYVDGPAGADRGQAADWSRDQGQEEDPDYSAYGRHRHPPGGRHR